MATTLPHTTTAAHSASESFKAWLLQLQERAGNYWHYRKTIAELSSLSDRELADMGMGRSFIKRTALEAVYGTRDA